jgi:hypothetical protein
MAVIHHSDLRHTLTNSASLSRQHFTVTFGQAFTAENRTIIYEAGADVL